MESLRLHDAREGNKRELKSYVVQASFYKVAVCCITTKLVLENTLLLD